MDLNQDFIKYQISGTTSYYGYTYNLDGGTSSNIWSIRQVVGTGPSDVNWSNKKKFKFTSRWDDRAFYFQSPTGSWASGVTWSALRGTSSFGNYADLNIRFSTVRGVDTYGIRIKDQSNKLMSSNGDYINNTYVIDPYTEIVEPDGKSSLNYNFRGVIGITYSVEVEAFNGYGSLKSNFQFYVI